ncbi:MAG: hypothetical protein JRJ84_13105 [Deltaproteobacteria bacterium]|nr:hypothetical protein [Deltaproteobacteria bacterium]
MIALLIALCVAQAQPGRTVAGLSAAIDPGQPPALRGTLDYGLARGLAVAGEAGFLPGRRALALGAGLVWEPVDGRWWNAGLLAMPEWVVPLGPDDAPGMDLGLGRTRVVGRASARVRWLALWGLSVTARVDRVQPFDRSGGWFELGAGLAVRM